MQSEEPTIIQSLENHLAEYGHTTVGQDIAAAILVIKDLHQKAALSAQVQDVAVPDFFYRIEYDYRSYVEKKTMWGLYRELGVVSLEDAQEALRTAQQNNAGNFRISRKPVVKWEPLPAAPAKEEGGHD